MVIPAEATVSSLLDCREAGERLEPGSQAQRVRGHEQGSHEGEFTQGSAL